MINIFEEAKKQAESLGGIVEVNWLNRELPSPSDQREYAKERIIVAVSEALAEALESAGISQAELARRLGVSQGRVSQLLSERNLTLQTIGDVLWACGFEFQDIAVTKLGVSAVPRAQASEWFLGATYQLEPVEAESPATQAVLAFATMEEVSAEAVVSASAPSRSLAA